MTTMPHRTSNWAGGPWAGFSMARRCLRASFLGGTLAAGLLAQCQQVVGVEPDTNSPTAVAGQTNNQETLRAYLQLQEQLQLTQLAIEQNRKEAREARESAAQNSDILAGRLQSIERALELQRTRELEAMQSSNRQILLAAGIVAGIGFLAMILMSFFQWRTVNRLAEITAGFPATLALPPASERPGLGPLDSHQVTVGPAEQSNLRMLGALEQLERRIYELEHTTHAPLNPAASASNGGKAGIGGESGTSVVGPVREHSGAIGPGGDSERIPLLMGKGQSMLNLDDAQAAIACFEEVLAVEPNYAEAWVRKGTALERLQQLDRAIECYDRAIAADNSLTIAYLHKGGLFNRMERFTEALECYEKALRTQEKRRA